MSEVDVSESSSVRLKGVGDWPTVWMPILFVLMIFSFGLLVHGIVVDQWTWPAEERRIVRTCILVVAGMFNFFCFWGWWRDSVIDVSLSEESLTVSTRAKQTVLAVSDLRSCELFINRSFTRVKVFFLLKGEGETERVEVFLYRSKFDPLKDLQLLPALQRRGVEMIGVEEFKRDIERLTGKSTVGLFDESGSLKAGGSA